MKHSKVMVCFSSAEVHCKAAGLQQAKVSYTDRYCRHLPFSNLVPKSCWFVKEIEIARALFLIERCFSNFLVFSWLVSNLWVGGGPPLFSVWSYWTVWFVFHPQIPCFLLIWLGFAFVPSSLINLLSSSPPTSWEILVIIIH